MKLWETSKYYKAAEKGSLDNNHFGMRLLKSISQNCSNILDLGCGEGTRLNYLAAGKKGTGVDISKKAINLANAKYPKFVFKQMNLEDLIFEDGKFDLVYSAFVLEHLINPEKVISEAVRVSARNGSIVFIAPNYGAPNRASPVYKGMRINKFISGILNDFLVPLRNVNGLSWQKVSPIDDPKIYVSDNDTTIEPYLGSLINYLKKYGLEIRQYSSCWEEELPDAKIHQKFFKVLGKIGLYPFNLWGPHLVVFAQKI